MKALIIECSCPGALKAAFFPGRRLGALEIKVGGNPTPRGILII